MDLDEEFGLCKEKGPGPDVFVIEFYTINWDLMKKDL